ncbi:tRNA pseudouridine38-40 synthase [Lewinella marina]|uniref:tRNA pseudouridine synthase A n=1 Tax=Neolewinella marina TaxID=438751 RepID=A0A2G0CH05_9BACT|nr:tRNA pseudouridine(38-40) synthase TruA [Neolewinella marina]NJB86268.1 tRNA pseudouridine38-40 synthase [Neolewinella marina]PHK99259.1 tRNA pseudouridine(38-40) synthase TruA [Neolewinella marina]
MTTRRYLLELAYCGTAYAGWQRQPNALSVEETVDTALSTMLGAPIKLVGCGRTDAGVHASDYAAHFDFDGALPPRLLGRLNRYLPVDIALRGLYLVPEELHARFSATGRAYAYHLNLEKDPFRPDTVAWVPALGALDYDRMQEAASLLLDYGAFAPFCKTNSDAYTMNCTLTESRWEFGERALTYHISANRFLRGMVRLIVGMCLRVGEGKLALDEVRRALDGQQRLPRPWSAPASGLYLTRVSYPDRTYWQRVP